MNQILMLEDKSKEKKTKTPKKQKKEKNMRMSSGPVEIRGVVKFFSVVIIIFALFIISHSSYAIYRDTKGSSTENLPEIYITRVNDTLIVEVQSVYVINTFKYNWENAEQRSISEGTTSFEEEIILPSTDNTLTIILEDETGRAIKYTKEIIIDGIDIVKPTITITKQTTSIRITAVDETAIEYITYRIDDGVEIRIDKNNQTDTRIEYAITDIERGEHTIYVTAVDQAGNTSTEEQAVIVSSEVPEITELTLDEGTGILYIGVSDVDGIQSMEVNLNGAVYSMDDINLTEAKFSLQLVEGTNTLSIKVTNINGLTTEGVTELEYAQ